MTATIDPAAEDYLARHGVDVAALAQGIDPRAEEWRVALPARGERVAHLLRAPGATIRDVRLLRGRDRVWRLDPRSLGDEAPTARSASDVLRDRLHVALQAERAILEEVRQRVSDAESSHARCDLLAEAVSRLSAQRGAVRALREALALVERPPAG